MPLPFAASLRPFFLRSLAAACCLSGALAAPALASYDTTVSDTPGLLSYWKLDETSGTTAADQTGAAPATYAGSSGLGVGGAPGIPGSRAIAPTGTTASVPTVYPFTGTAAYTMEAWVKPSQPQNGYNFIVQREISSPSRSGYNMGVAWQNANPSGGFFCERWANGASFGLISTSSLAIGVWTHVACTYDGANLSLYINGSLNRTRTAPAIPDSSANPLRIGAATAGTGAKVLGSIDNVAIYSRALTSPELSAHAVAGQTYADALRGAPGLRSRYTLDADTTSQPDAGPANVTATLTGAAAATGDPLTSGSGSSTTLAGDGPLNAPALQLSNPGSTELWFRPRTLQDAWLWYGATTATGDGLGPEQETGIRLTASGRLQLWSTGQTATPIDLGPYTPGAAHQLAISIASNVWRVFVNGEQVYGGTLSPQTFAGYLPRTTYGGLFAAGSSGAFTGELDDISTFNVALGVAEVADHWTLGRRAPSAPLVESGQPAPSTPPVQVAGPSMPQAAVAADWRQLGRSLLHSVQVPGSTAERDTFSFTTNRRTQVQIRLWCRASTTDCPPRPRTLRDDDDAATARLVFVRSMTVRAHRGRNAIRLDRLMPRALKAGRYVISVRLVRMRGTSVVRSSESIGRAVMLEPATVLARASR